MIWMRREGRQSIEIVVSLLILSGCHGFQMASLDRPCAYISKMAGPTIVLRNRE